MSEINELPKGWAFSILGDIAVRITKGGTPTTYGYSFKSSGINFLKVENIKNGRVNLMSLTDFIDEETHVFQLKSQLSVNDILFSIAGTIGETCIIKDEYLPANTNQALAIIKGTDCAILPKLIYFQLEAFVAKIKIKARGGAMNNVSLDDLKKLLVVIPPLPEQHRIVAKIEELFSSLDKGIENLKTAQAQLKTYRQAVLKWAFEGKLTKTKDIDWVQLGELCINVEYGSASKSKETGKIPVLRMGNIQNGRFDWSDLVYSNDSEEIDKYLLKKNDVLFNRTNSPEWVGKTAIYKGERPAIFAGYLIRINYKKDMINPDYLTYFLNSHTAKKYGNSIKSFGVNQSNINGTKLKTYPFPKTSISEQQAIVSEIETRLSVCDKLEESITQSLMQSEALRQSILKKAFEGKLVPQDSNDEPASVLLARIRGEREKNVAENGKGKKKIIP
jgi:type I restriction enzyme S subunit